MERQIGRKWLVRRFFFCGAFSLVLGGRVVLFTFFAQFFFTLFLLGDFFLTFFKLVVSSCQDIFPFSRRIALFKSRRDFSIGRVLKCCMINSKQHVGIARDSQYSRDAEQQLCSDALQSTSYDHMTDKEWIALCEQVAVEAREVKASSDAPHQ